MSDDINSESIEAIVDERLDQIFGEDDGKAMPIKPRKASPFAEIKILTADLDFEITDESLSEIDRKIEDLSQAYASHPHVAVLFKIITTLMKYMKSRKEETHSDAVHLLRTTFQCMETLIEDQNISLQEKKALVANEIDRFKDLKSELLAAEKPAPAIKETPPAAPPKPEAPVQAPPAPAEPPPAEPMKPEAPVEAPPVPQQAPPAPAQAPPAPQQTPPAPPPEPTPPGKPVAPAFTAQDLSKAIGNMKATLGEEFNRLKSELTAIKQEATKVSEAESVLPEDFQALKQQVDELKAVPAELTSLKSYLDRSFSELGLRLDREKETATSGEPAQDIRDELEALKTRVDSLKSLPEELEDLKDALRNEFEDMKAEIKNLQKIPEQIKTLRSDVGKALAMLNEQVKALRAEPARPSETAPFPTEDIDALKNKVDELSGIPEHLEKLRASLAKDLKNLKAQVTDAKASPRTPQKPADELMKEFKGLKDMMEALKGDLNQLRQDFMSTDLAIGDISDPGDGEQQAYLYGDGDDVALFVDDEIEGEGDSILPPSRTSDRPVTMGGTLITETPPEPSIDNESILQSIESLEKGEEDLDVVVENETGKPLSRKATGSYFLFQLGGRKYAMEARNVIKACKAGDRLLKKGMEKGGIAISDCKGTLLGLKHGIEPPWRNLSPKELKDTTFTLIFDDRIEGLQDTHAGGVLFLGIGDKRLALLTDDQPVKAAVTDDLEVRKLTGKDFIRGAVKKTDAGEKYLLFDTVQISTRTKPT